jgi:hypothetical protein
MKQLFKHFALLVMGALISGCAAEVDDLQPTTNGTVTMKTTISLSEQASTRALDINGNKTFAAGDQIAVVYEQESGTAKALSVALTDDDITNGGKDAAFTVTLSNPKASGKVRYIYPASMVADDVSTTTPGNDATIKWSNLNTQDGLLSSLASKLDLATFDGEMTAQGNLPKTATLANQLTIAKFIIKNSATNSTITGNITKLTISDGTNTYTVNTSSHSTIYVAMKPIASSQTIDVTAFDGKDKFTKSVTGQTLAANTMYAVNVTVDRLAASMTLAAVTTSEVGWRIGSDGTAYQPTGLLPSGVTAVAMITYVGNATGETSYIHGLALAMSDANNGNTCSWKTSQTDAGHTYKTNNQSDFSIISESGLQYNDATHDSDTYPAFKYAMANNGIAAPTECSAWFLPTGYQWNQMINACKNVLGTKNSSDDLRDGFSGVGGTNLQTTSPYWSSTESKEEYAWYYYFSDEKNWAYGTKNNNTRYVRAALAF